MEIEIIIVMIGEGKGLHVLTIDKILTTTLIKDSKHRHISNKMSNICCKFSTHERKAGIKASSCTSLNGIWIGINAIRENAARIINIVTV